MPLLQLVNQHLLRCVLEYPADVVITYFFVLNQAAAHHRALVAED